MKTFKILFLIIGIIGVFLTSLITLQHGLAIIPQLSTLNYKNIDNPLIYFFPVILLFSFFTFRMMDEVSKSWIKFTAWYVPILIIAVLILPMNISGGLGIGDFYREGMNRLALALLFLVYVVVSTIMIVKARRASK